MTEQPAAQYVTIVGVGRSGTSLLMSMLDSHSMIGFIPEIHFLNRFMGLNSNEGYLGIIDQIENDEKFMRLRFDKKAFLGKRKNLKRRLSMLEFYKEIMEWQSETIGKRYIGDKAPKYIEYLPLIKESFPEAKIIHLVRDPRDVYLSRTKAKWSSGRTDLLHLLAYQSQFKMGRSHGRILFGNNYLEVQYELLITDPEMQLKRICHFMNVPFEEGMLEYMDSASNLISEFEKSWKKETLDPLMSKNFNKWKSELSSPKILKIESACAAVFECGLYRKNYKSVPLIWRAYGMFLRSLSVFYSLYVIMRSKIILNSNKIVARRSPNQ